MKKQFAIALSAAALLASSASFAKAGPYVSIGAGIGGMNTESHAGVPLDSTPSANATVKNSKTRNQGLNVGRLAAGYMFDSTGPLQYGVEAGFNKYGDNTYKTVVTEPNQTAETTKLSYSRHDFDLLGVAKYNVNDCFNVFGKAGFAYANQERSFKANGAKEAKFSDKQTGLMPEAVIGVGYDFNENIGANLAYSHVFGNKVKNDDTSLARSQKLASVDSLTLNLTYSF